MQSGKPIANSPTGTFSARHAIPIFRSRFVNNPWAAPPALPGRRRGVKISTKGLYGTLAVLDLAVHYSTGHVHKADIAARQNIPEQYLAQLLAALRRAGIVRSVRGPGGGHALAKPPAEITVAEVVQLLDGPQDRVPAEAPTAGRAVVDRLIARADEAALLVLSEATFDTLVEQWRKAQNALDFVI